jgi:hypothetical protein
VQRYVDPSKPQRTARSTSPARMRDAPGERARPVPDHKITAAGWFDGNADMCESILTGALR